VLVLLITAETTLLLLDGASATSMPSPAACTFMGLCQLFALFFFAVTFLSGVWTESPFKLNAATVVILLLTLYILDRSLTATSLRQGWGYAWQVGELALCPNNLTLSAASVAAGVLRTDLYRCCTDFSISTQCAAYTQRVSGLTPFTSSYLAFLCVGLLGLFLLFEVIARRSFGWRVHSRQQTYEKHARWLNTRTMQHRVVTLLDVFLSSSAHPTPATPTIPTIPTIPTTPHARTVTWHRTLPPLRTPPHTRAQHAAALRLDRLSHTPSVLRVCAVRRVCVRARADGSARLVQSGTPTSAGGR
jgi:hypothetical protein